MFIVKRIVGISTLTIVLSVILSLNAFSSNENKAYGWGLKPGKPGESPEVGQLYESIIDKHNAYYIDKTTSKKLYLTFDAGYETGTTPKILDVLKAQKVNATFFLVGDYLKKEPDLVKKMVNEGHIIGNHTWTHPDLTKLNKERYKEELQKFEDYYTDLTGKKLLKILRPPAGTFSERSLKIADELGYGR